MSNMIGYLPQLYREIREFVELTDTEDEEFNLLLLASGQFFADQFVDTSSATAIKRRETQLGIRADPAMETLEFRKLRVKNRYSTRPPFTIRYLQSRLDDLAGAPGVAVAYLDVHNFLLTVTASIDDANVFGEIERTIYIVKPANINYLQRTGVADTLALQEHISYKVLNRTGMKLGNTWRLGVSAFGVLEPEVVVK